MTGGEFRLLTEAGGGILTAESAENTEEEWEEISSFKAVRFCVACANCVYICQKVLGVVKTDHDADRAIMLWAIMLTLSLNYFGVSDRPCPRCGRKCL